MSISRQYAAAAAAAAAAFVLTISRNIGSNRASLVKRKFSPNLNGLHLDANTYVYSAMYLFTRRHTQPLSFVSVIEPFAATSTLLAASSATFNPTNQCALLDLLNYEPSRSLRQEPRCQTIIGFKTILICSSDASQCRAFRYAAIRLPELAVGGAGRGVVAQCGT